MSWEIEHNGEEGEFGTGVMPISKPFPWLYFWLARFPHANWKEIVDVVNENLA